MFIFFMAELVVTSKLVTMVSLLVGELVSLYFVKTTISSGNVKGRGLF